MNREPALPRVRPVNWRITALAVALGIAGGMFAGAGWALYFTEPILVDQQMAQIWLSQRPADDHRLMMTANRHDPGQILVIVEWLEETPTARPMWAAVCPREAVDQRTLRGCKATQTNPDAQSARPYSFGVATFDTKGAPARGFVIAILDDGTVVKGNVLGPIGLATN